MNKNVFDYLNGKAHDVADYIKAKAEAAGNYISDHAQDIKNGAIKTTATILTAATLFTGLAACDKTPSDDPQSSQQEQQNSNTLYPIVTVKPREEIEAEGITSKDVLALYDNLSFILAKKEMHRYAEANGYTTDDISGQFINLNTSEKPLLVNGNRELQNEPFYHKINKDTYMLSYNYNAAVKNKTQPAPSILYVKMDPQTIENLMNLFNITPIILTEDYWKENPTYAESYNNVTGETVYPAFKFTREVINSANEDQLWALYNIGEDLTAQFANSIQDREFAN